MISIVIIIIHRNAPFVYLNNDSILEQRTFHSQQTTKPTWVITTTHLLETACMDLTDVMAANEISTTYAAAAAVIEQTTTG